MSAVVLLIPIGVVIGILLGSVGGGGSLLAVPALVYLGDQSVRGAQAGALVVVVVASGFGFVSYLRRGQVRWRAGLAFGAAAAVSSVLGSVLSRALDPNVLLLAFAPVMVLGAAAMVSGRATAESHFRPWRLGVSVESASKVILSGLAIGMLTGLFGVGGGFVIVPVLTIGLGLAVTEAVGTSLLVVIVGSLAALADRLHGGVVDWSVTLPFAAAAAAGVVLGSSLGERTSARDLTRWLAVLIVLTAVYTAVRSTAALV